MDFVRSYLWPVEPFCLHFFSRSCTEVTSYKIYILMEPDMSLFHDAAQKTAATGLYKPATIAVRYDTFDRPDCT